jgi:SPP1 gp7 family putative phage head morphogenesis protein
MPLDEVYWTNRQIELMEKAFIEGAKTVDEIEVLFRTTNRNMTKEINLFYAKYGVIEEAPIFKTLSDGTRVIAGTTQRLVVPPNVANVALTKGTRLTKLQLQLHELLKLNSVEQNTLMKEGLRSIAQTTYYDNIYEIYKGVGTGSNFAILDPTLVNAIISNPVNGQNFSTRVWNNRRLLENQVNQTLLNGIITGIPNREMAKTLAKNMSSGFSVADRLIRTEVTNTYNQAALQSYEDSGMVEHFEYLAVLDNRTSEVCDELDGQIFKLSEAQTGLNVPPLHPRCRSTTIPSFDKSKKQLERIALQGNRPFTVPANMTSKDFKNIYVNKSITRKQWDRTH